MKIFHPLSNCKLYSIGTTTNNWIRFIWNRESRFVMPIPIILMMGANGDDMYKNNCINNNAPFVKWKKKMQQQNETMRKTIQRYIYLCIDLDYIFAWYFCIDVSALNIWVANFAFFEAVGIFIQICIDFIYSFYNQTKRLNNTNSTFSILQFIKCQSKIQMQEYFQPTTKIFSCHYNKFNEKQMTYLSEQKKIWPQS